MLTRCCRRASALRSGWQWPSRCLQPRRTSWPGQRRDELATPLQRAFGEGRQRTKEQGPQGFQRRPQKPSQRNALLLALTGTVLVSAAFYLEVTPFRSVYSWTEEWDNRIPQEKFIPYTLVRKQPVSSTMSIFHLRPSDNNKLLGMFSEAWEAGVWNMLFKQPQIQVVRAYTPLPPVSPTGESLPDQDLRFLIRWDQRGEVSSWLHRLPTSSSVEAQGPNLEYEVKSHAKHVVFLAGGTGIATALQAANALLSRRHNDSSDQLPTIHILWANRRREDCTGGVSDHAAFVARSHTSRWIPPLVEVPSSKDVSPNSEKGLIVKELDALKARFPDQVSVDYFVDEENTWITADVVAGIYSGFEGTHPGRKIAAKDRAIIVSGPDGFVEHFAGSRLWRNGQLEQGPVKGVVAQVLAKTGSDTKVWKS